MALKKKEEIKVNFVYIVINIFFDKDANFEKEFSLRYLKEKKRSE